MLTTVNHARREWQEKVNIPVFLLAAGFSLSLILFGGIYSDTAGKGFENLLSFITTMFGWYYVLAMGFFVGFVFWVLLSGYGDIRLGDPEEPPQFSLPSWLSMLFAAGMGMGLVFWGVAEPLNHYQTPPHAASLSSAAAQEAIRFSFFHWALHPWAVYVIFALSIAPLPFSVQTAACSTFLVVSPVGQAYSWMAGACH